YMVLWWIPTGTVPTVAEAQARLERLRRGGPSPEAFTFRSPFPPPDARGEIVAVHGDWCCPI
ncbi:MAG: DUF3291 domain-containing protein, partial [Actinomycetota bacterium]|nr:DUF3291 domain-containing protein [Actinomycetota bacterium]